LLVVLMAASMFSCNEEDVEPDNDTNQGTGGTNNAPALVNDVATTTRHY